MSLDDQAARSLHEAARAAQRFANLAFAQVQLPNDQLASRVQEAAISLSNALADLPGNEQGAKRGPSNA